MENNKIDKKYVWATEDIYENLDLFEEDFKFVKENSDFSRFKGTLGDKNAFLECMKEKEKVIRKLDTLSVYAYMNYDKDTRNSFYDSLNQRVNMLATTLSENLSFIVPELTKLKISVLESYILDPSLKDYDYFLKSLIKQKKHILSEREEKLLALLGQTTSSFKDIFTKADNVDLPLSPIKYKGKEYPLSHGYYGVYMHQGERGLRKKAFTEYYNAYLKMINTISSTYFGNVKKNVFYAKARKYKSVLDMMLDDEDVSPIVYKNLINGVNKSLPTLHKYMSVKKKTLKLKKMYMYDAYVPLVENAELSLSYDKAYELVIDGLSVLGEDYVNLLKRAKDERWIDVYETSGKRSGAYSICVYDTHPFVLLNYQQTTHDVFTIAHEMGHSIHSYFSNKNQPYEKADYRIFVAEVASTVNEVLLVKHMLKNSKDVTLKKYLLTYLLEMIRTTLYRQTQFSEFEEFAHSSVENGVPLNKENLTEAYRNLNKKYYGKAVCSEGLIGYEWARIPHFYRAFYVYKYATGIISALAIANRILTEGKPAIEDYFKFLSSGGSDSPVNELKLAGVDLTTKEPFTSAFNVFKDTLNEFIELSK